MGSNGHFYASATISIQSLHPVHAPGLSEPDSEVLDSAQLAPYALEYGLERSSV